MLENPHKSSSLHVRTSKRGKGERLTKAETQLLQEKFLKSFSMTANVRAACMQTGIDRKTIRNWEENDETFSFRYREAKEDANDLIRAELHRRAIQGYDKPVTSFGRVATDENGKIVTEKVYSDNLLALLAKARLPEFREKKSIEHSGPDGGPIQIQRDPNLQLLTDEELAQAQQIALQLLHRQGGPG